jgi:rhomboid protease GluP
MKVLALKLRHIYAPFLVVTAGFVAGYSLLAWALVYRTRLFNVDEDLVTLWLPLGLAWVPALLWIRPRIKVLKLETSKGDLPFLYLIVAVATMAAPTVQGQMYLSKATACITRLGEISEIRRSPSTRYYTVERPCLRREGHQSHWAAEMTGRHGEYLTRTMTVVVPFCDPAGSTSAEAAPAWLGITFRRSIHAAYPEEEKERAALALAKESESAFKAMDLGAFSYLELVGPGAKRRAFDTAIHKGVAATPDPVVLEARQDVFDARAGNLDEWALGTFGVGATLWLFMLLFPGIHSGRLRHLVNGTQAAEPQPRFWRAFLVPNRHTFGTLSLGYVNLIAFLAMVFAGLGVVGFHFEDLVGWGALARPLLHGAGFLRLVTYQFVHGGLMHIVNNLYGLFFAGLMLEAVIGGRRLLVAYLIAGVFGGIASVLVHPATVTVGASGSIFGLFGVLFGLLLVKDERVAPARNFLLINAGIYVGLNLLLGAVMPGVDNAAHVGGLLAGLVMGPFLRKGSTGKGRPVLRLSGPDL